MATDREATAADRTRLAPGQNAGCPSFFSPGIFGFFLGLLLVLTRPNPVYAQETVPSPANNLIQRGWSEFHSHHLDLAENLFRTALGSPTNNLEALRGLAESSYAAAQYDQAVAAYEHLIAADPAATNAYYGLGKSYYELKHYAKAESSFRKFAALKPRNQWGFYLLYCSLHQQENYPDALDAIQRATALDRKNAKFETQLGICLFMLDRDEQAAAVLKQALAVDPRNIDATYWLGNCYFSLKDYSLAITPCQEFLSLNPTNTRTRFKLGMCYFNLKSYPLAVEAFQQDTLQNRSDFKAFYWLGFSLEDLGRYSESASAFQRAAQIIPADFDANLWSGVMLFRTAQFPAAIPNLEQAHKIKKDNQLARHALFGVYLLTGDYKKAHALWPGIFLVGGGLLMLGYIVAGTTLLWFSLKIRPHPHPGFWFSLAWLSVFFEGQAACIALLAFLSLSGVNISILASVILAGVPVLIAARKGFALQPWGAPFAWPPRLGPPRMTGFAMLALVLLAALDSGYSVLYTAITHQPVPLQDSVPLVKYALASHPVTACLAIVMVAPMVEEILFRGLIFGALSRRFAPWAVMVISALLFAAVHLDPVYLPPLFCMGMILAWFRWKSGSLGLSILIHCANNGLSLLILKLFGDSN